VANLIFVFPALGSLISSFFSLFFVLSDAAVAFTGAIFFSWVRENCGGIPQPRDRRRTPFRFTQSASQPRQALSWRIIRMRLARHPCATSGDAMLHAPAFPRTGTDLLREAHALIAPRKGERSCHSLVHW